MIDATLALLRELDNAGVDFACIGTFGLHLHGLLPADYALHDADIVMPDDARRLARCCAHLRARGWYLLLWDEPLTTVPDMATLQEKYYLRAVREELMLDMVFSGLALPVAAILANRQHVNGIPVARVEDIVLMKRHRDTPSDRALLTQIGESLHKQAGR